MRKLPFNNESSPSERVAVHRNDERVRRGGTYHGIASGEASAPSGRFGAISRSTVIGAGGPQYPKQPPDSPWATDPVGQEPSLGYSVESQAPVGEMFEVEKSVAEADGGEGLKPLPPLPLTAQPGGESGSAAPDSAPEHTGSPLSKSRRKR